MFVPSHAGIRGNERADRLSGLATILKGQPMDHAGISNHLRDAGRVADFWRNESTFKSRLCELGLKISITQMSDTPGSQTKL